MVSGGKKAGAEKGKCCNEQKSPVPRIRPEGFLSGAHGGGLTGKRVSFENVLKDTVRCSFQRVLNFMISLQYFPFWLNKQLQPRE
jgi:hypothetical protein